MLHASMSKRFTICTLVLTLLFGITALSAQAGALRKPVTLNSVDEPLSSVLSTLARLSGTNIVLATDQAGTAAKEQKRVTISIKDVPVETAVSLVAKSAGLSYKIYGDNTLLVGTQQNISESSGQSNHIIYLNNLDAVKVSAALANTDGTVVPLEGQNAIMVYGNTDAFESIRDLVQQIDVPQKQIEDPGAADRNQSQRCQEIRSGLEPVKPSYHHSRRRSGERRRSWIALQFQRSGWIPALWKSD